MKNGSTGLDSGIVKGIPDTDAVETVNKTKSTNPRSEKASCLVNSINKKDCSKQSSDMNMLGVPSSAKLVHESITNKFVWNERKECWDKSCDESAKSLNSSTPGPLRYALHLRFICPFPKKSIRSVQKCSYNSLPEKAGLDMEGERRFYLCNDMKVVFPQRHSDADEGKVRAYIVALPSCCVFFHAMLKLSKVIWLLAAYAKNCEFTCSFLVLLFSLSFHIFSMTS